MAKSGRGRPRKKTPSSESAEFFKIFLPQLCYRQLKIPPDFIKNFGENMPKIVTLRRQSGQSWQVDMKRINDNWFFQEGWPEFVQENSIEENDFLTFCYNGYSRFRVKIFTRSGCLKRDDCANGESIENLQGSESSEPDCKENRATERNLSPKKSITRKSVHGNPSFSIVLTKSYIHKGLMHLPKEFGRMYVKKYNDRPRMVTLWIENKSWDVHLIVGFRGRLQFSRGWSKFMKDNSPQNGDLCTFQLIDWDNLAFRVTVSK